MPHNLSPSPFSFAALDRLKLESVYHYHQPHGRHPRAIPLPPYYERIELVTGGRGWILDGKKWREVLPGDLIWNKPGDYTIGRSDFESPYRCLAVTLIGKRRGGHGLPRFSRCSDLGEVKHFVRDAVQRFADDSFDRCVLKAYVVGRLLFWMHIHHHAETHPELPAPLRAAVEWMTRHYATPCRIDELARAAGWSPAYLHEAFRHHLQTTPHQMLIRHRLHAVRDKLVSTLHPIKQIAVECGFADAPTLTHAFKAAFGVTPKAYRDRHMHLAGL